MTKEVIRIHILEKNKQHNDQREVIRIHILEKNKQHNDQKKKYKKTNNDLQNIKLKIE